MADTATIVATVLLIAFVIDRVVAALMFVSEYIALPRSDTPESKAKRSDYLKRFAWFFVAAVLGGVALLAFDIHSVKLGAVNPKWNAPLLWLILVGGADRISQFLATPAKAPSVAATKEFRVAGTLTLDRESADRLNAAAQ